MPRSQGDDDLESIPQRVGLVDVARESGVSRSTVSRVLSGATNVSPAAAHAVRAAAKKLGYTPDPSARALRGGSTGCVGMVVPEIGNPYFAELVEAIEGALQLNGIELMICDSRSAVEHETSRIESLVAHKVDGIVVVAVDHLTSRPAIERVSRTIPVVQVDRRIDGFRADFVGVDNTAGIHLVLHHLIDAGARSVVFVSGDDSTSTGRARLGAFNSLVADVPALQHRYSVLGEFTFEFGRKAAADIIARTPLPDAIACGSDVLALGIVRHLLDEGYSIPDDVMVTGFDGIRFMELTNPSLTTVRQPVAEIAGEAVRLLLQRMRGDESAAHSSHIAPALAIRHSSRRSPR